MAFLSVYDWVFLVSAILFNLLIAAVFVAQKQGNVVAVKRLGAMWLALALPLGVVLWRFSAEGKPPEVLFRLGLVLLYMLVEYLLDYVFKYDFRARWATHLPYILLEYAALFSLISIATRIQEALGWVVGVCFWILLGTLIYYYAGRRKSVQV